MPTFCNNHPQGDAADYEYVECSTGAQYPSFWVCVGADAAACTTGSGVTYYNSENYFLDEAGWTTATGLDLKIMSNASLLAGESSGGGGGGSFLPELSLEDGGLLAAAIAGIWALGLCLRLIRKQLEDS